MPSNLETRLARLEQMSGTGSRVLVVFDDAPGPDDKGLSVIRVRFVDPPVDGKEQSHES